MSNEPHKGRKFPTLTVAARVDQLVELEALGSIETRVRENETPCPTCGSKDFKRSYRYTKGNEPAGLDLHTDDGRWWCYCGYAEGPRPDHPGESEEDALKSWSSTHLPPKPQEDDHAEA